MPVHARVHVRVGMHMHVRMHVHVRMDVHMLMAMHARIHTHVRMRVRVTADVHVCAGSLCMGQAYGRSNREQRYSETLQHVSTVELFQILRSSSQKPRRVDGLIDIAPKLFARAQTVARWTSECSNPTLCGGC
jgi:hypothetical protein